jgi:serine/threonine-protein kinase
MACLERLRGALEAQVEILARADAGVVEQAVAAVTGLPPPRTCLRPDANEPASPDDPALASRHAALWSELSRVEALERSGKYHEALALAEQVLEHARALEHPSLEAPVLLALGEAHRKLGSFATAEQQLERAYFLGQELGRHEIVQKAAERLVVAVGVGQQDHERGLEWARHAEAALGRDADGLARAEFLASFGALRRERGEYAEALAAHEESLELYRAALAPDRLEIAHALSAIGIVLRKLGRNEEALTHHEQALTIFEAALGPEHPDIAAKLGNLATAQLRTGHAEQAASTMQRSLAIREAALGTDHTEIATTLTSLSVILSELGRHDEAEHAAQRALSILERTGTQPHTLCAALINLANARHLAGRYEPAMQIHRRAVVECEQAGLEDHLDFAQELFNFGQTLQELHALEEADAVLRRAVAILERSAQPVPERIMLVYNLLASVSLARGRFDEAIANAERWLALEPTVSPPPRHRVAMGWVLAQAQWGAGQRELALTHARDAARRAAALDDGPHAQQLRDDIRSWRAEHDPELGAPVAP